MVSLPRLFTNKTDYFTDECAYAALVYHINIILSKALSCLMHETLGSKDSWRILMLAEKKKLLLLKVKEHWENMHSHQIKET